MRLPAARRAHPAGHGGGAGRRTCSPTSRTPPPIRGCGSMADHLPRPAGGRPCGPIGRDGTSRPPHPDGGRRWPILVAADRLAARPEPVDLDAARQPPSWAHLRRHRRLGPGRADRADLRPAGLPAASGGRRARRHGHRRCSSAGRRHGRRPRPTASSCGSWTPSRRCRTCSSASSSSPCSRAGARRGDRLGRPHPLAPAARIVRSEVLSLRSAAVRRRGDLRWRDPEAGPPPPSAAARPSPAGLATVLMVPHAMWHETALRFLGLGLPPHLASLGNMINDGQGSLLTGDWWSSLAPGRCSSSSSPSPSPCSPHRWRDRLDPRWPSGAGTVTGQPDGLRVRRPATSGFRCSRRRRTCGAGSERRDAVIDLATPGR